MDNAGYDPIKLAESTEKIVVDGNKRKYVQLGRPLRFYGGTTSATECPTSACVRQIGVLD